MVHPYFYDTERDLHDIIAARPRKDLLENLHEELISGKISRMRPFGQALPLKMRGSIDNTDPACGAINIKGGINLSFSFLTLLEPHH